MPMKIFFPAWQTRASSRGVDVDTFLDFNQLLLSYFMALH